MGAGASTVESRDIDRDIKKEQKTLKRVVTLMLLGAGESGKSTVLKQMKLLHLNAFQNTKELLTYKPMITFNVLESMQTIVKFCRTADIAISLDLEDAVDRVLETSCHLDQVPAEIAEDVVSLWADDGVQESYSRSAEYQLFDHAAYFIEKAIDIARDDFVPTVDDILRCRIRTVGVNEITFDIHEGRTFSTFRLVDVGGQRVERRKWINCFDGVDAIIFVVSLSEYNQRLYEDNKTNRMKEALQLFNDTINLPIFVSKGVIVFFNKRDLFEIKIQTVPLTCCFKTYTGGSDAHAAQEYIKTRFLSCNQPLPDGRLRSIYSHVTTATDTGNISAIFRAATDSLLRNALQAGGML